MRLHLPPSATVDLEEASAALVEAEAAVENGRPADGVVAAEGARAVLALELLPGAEGAWVDGRREDMAAGTRRAAQAAGSCHLGLGRTAPAIAVALTAVRTDPFDEAGHRLLMRAHAAAGERGAALATYERCRAQFDDELGVRPSAATEALFVELLGEAPGPPTPATRRPVVRTPAPTTPPGPFVGRAAELGAMERSWNAVAGGSGAQVVVIEGEAGAGKSRLALELADRASAGGGRVLWGRCSPDVGFVYEPILEALGRALSEVPGAIDRLGPHAAELASLLPELGTGEGRAGATGATSAADPASRARLFQAMAAAAGEVADGPTLWVIDDLQWAPPDTTALLHHLVTALTSSPVLLALTCRSAAGPVAAALATLGRTVPCRTIVLEGLNTADLVELFVAAGMGAPGDLDETARVVRERTGGNAFFVDQLGASRWPAPGRSTRWPSLPSCEPGSTGASLRCP